jgi:hypothetical protein
MTHTLGPWVAFDYVKQPGIFGAGIASVNEAAGPSTIAFLSATNETANGRLIAAAPDLLENLRQLCDLLESIGHDCTPAREAITKATGETK